MEHTRSRRSTKKTSYESAADSGPVFANTNIQTWVISLFGQQVDIAWFDVARTAREVRDALIYQEGYSVDIQVHRPG